MTRTISYALEFIVDTLDYSPDECNVPESEADLLSQPSQDPTEKDLFAIVLWNDEKHAFSEVNRQLMETCGCTMEEAVTHTDRIDEEGRGVVEMGSCNSRLLEVAHGLAKVDLGVTVRRAFDTFREQISAVLIEWLHDLSRCRLRNNTTIIREIIAAELFSKRKKDINLSRANPDFAEAIAQITDPSKLEWLLLYHTRLWKKPRMDLKEIYVSLLTISHDHKLTIGEHLYLCRLFESPYVLCSGELCQRVSFHRGFLPIGRPRGGNIHQILGFATFHGSFGRCAHRKRTQDRLKVTIHHHRFLHQSNHEQAGRFPSSTKHRIRRGRISVQVETIHADLQ